MGKRATRHGLRKICGCPPKTWAKCEHSWHFSFFWKGTPHRYSLDRLTSDRIRLKTEAETEADRIRSEIRAGTFRPPGTPEPDAAPLSVAATLTLAQLLETYDRRYLQVERPATIRNERWSMAVICRVPLQLPTGDPRAFGDWLALDVTTDALEQFREARRPSGLVATNRNLALLRGCFNWAVRVGVLERTPFKRGTETVVKLSRELSRRRRLEPDEDTRLLAAAGPDLRALIEAALETGCRKSELLSLQWSQVRWTPRAELVLPAHKTKTKRERLVPISTRLHAILTMRQTAPDGTDRKPTDYVFGDATGARVKSFKRAWEATKLRAHGFTPQYVVRIVGEGSKARKVRTARLTPESRTQLRAINLRFHDLRREAGSRWLDGGVPLHTIRDWLGHANISQTSTYLESTFAGQHAAMQAFEDRRASLQKLANASETSGHQPLPTAEKRDRRTRKGADSVN